MDNKFLIRPEGEITVRTVEHMVHEWSRVLRDNNYSTVELDLHSVSIVDSRGIGVIVGLYKTLHAQSQSLTVTGLSEDLYDLFHLMRLDELFTISKRKG